MRPSREEQRKMLCNYKSFKAMKYGLSICWLETRCTDPGHIILSVIGVPLPGDERLSYEVDDEGRIDRFIMDNLRKYYS